MFCLHLTNNVCIDVIPEAIRLEILPSLAALEARKQLGRLPDVSVLLLFFRASLLSSTDTLRGDHVAFKIGDKSAPALAVILDNAALNDGFQVRRIRTRGGRGLAKEERREQKLPLQNTLEVQLTP